MTYGQWRTHYVTAPFLLQRTNRIIFLMVIYFKIAVGHTEKRRRVCMHPLMWRTEDIEMKENFNGIRFTIGT
jgi:hypothetical protein